MQCSLKNKIGVIQEPLAVYGRHYNNLSKKIVLNQYKDLSKWERDSYAINELKKFDNFTFITKKIKYLKIQDQIYSNIKFIQKIKFIYKHKNIIEKIKLILILILPENVIRFLRK